MVGGFFLVAKSCLRLQENSFNGHISWKAKPIPKDQEKHSREIKSLPKSSQRETEMENEGPWLCREVPSPLSSLGISAALVMGRSVPRAAARARLWWLRLRAAAPSLCLRQNQSSARAVFL